MIKTDASVHDTGITVTGGEEVGISESLLEEKRKRIRIEPD